ncbi:hypothetical protein T07_12101 [Trichinella nelsoni]|uniref:Uncharacterized protein n=1 Tax=Trichinella nelsoni TaxID=6336 RepID=A0A0V0RL62_9BILA|nr:hypothetical protein T07_8108 [Trichinella nelsoni]KRX15218.1 hypothetical protein T07_12101 [Trichinella nelsoni]
MLNVTSSTFVENPVNMMVPISGLHCTQFVGYPSFCILQLYSEVHVAINKNVGDTSLSFENV